jgi:DNA-binding MarR family transcriptional regulator
MPRRASGPAPASTALADRLHSAAIHLLRRVRRVDDATGLSAARLSALSVIAFAGPIRISGLASAEQVRMPTMTPIVAALERDGLVSRESDASDARAALLRVTPKGLRLMTEARSRRVAVLATELAALSAAERETLERAIAVLERLPSRKP